MRLPAEIRVHISVPSPTCRGIHLLSPGCGGLSRGKTASPHDLNPCFTDVTRIVADEISVAADEVATVASEVAVVTDAIPAFHDDGALSPDVCRVRSNVSRSMADAVRSRRNAGAL